MKKIIVTTHIKDNKNLYEVAHIENVPPNFLISAMLGLIIGFINGFWGGGGGMFCVPTLSNIVGLPEKRAHATAILIMLPLSIGSFVIYIIMGAFDGMTTLKVTIGFVVGSAIGALILNNIKNIVLNIIFAVVIIASGIKSLI